MLSAWTWLVALVMILCIMVGFPLEREMEFWTQYLRVTMETIFNLIKIFDLTMTASIGPLKVNHCERETHVKLSATPINWDVFSHTYLLFMWWYCQ